ncbi:hypothetical protein GZL_03253 [Streptomyces sp. 769]|nr:hypothetical protein GZL_03253 [Streptomyces sp. 769]
MVTAITLSKRYQETPKAPGTMPRGPSAGRRTRSRPRP